MNIISSIGPSVAHDHGSPVSDRYADAFPFAGTLHQVDIQLLTQRAGRGRRRPRPTSGPRWAASRMGTIRREVIIDRPPDDGLAADRRPRGDRGLVPGHGRRATVDGTSRVITAESGIPLPEEIVTNDPILRRFQYRVVAPMMRQHLGTIDVFDLHDGRSLVSYSTDADPDPVALVIGGATGNALEGAEAPTRGREEA